MNKAVILGLTLVATTFAQYETVEAQSWGRHYGQNYQRREIAGQLLDRTIKHALRNSNVNVNLIHNRGNGVNQRVVAHTPSHKRININLFKNAGNGQGNEVIAGGVRGGYNVNILENSANGRGNDMHLRGRGDLRNGININVMRDSINGDGNRLRAGYWR